ncbi:MAG: hypothetical protein HY812_11885 [Planctomycetes bacterium]|nr:hypothetical protein [Planctomycetota bacterium]
MMPASIFQCAEARRQERLVQGILRFLLTSDGSFLRTFCAWAGFPGECVAVHEDPGESGAPPHGLLLSFADGSARRVDLVFWAERGDARGRDGASADLFIVPEHRGRRFGPLPAAKTRTWADLVARAGTASDLACAVLHGLEDYVWTGEALALAALKDEIEAWWSDQEREWQVSRFLRGCAERAQEHGLSVSSSQKLCRQTGTGYWGQYFKNAWLPASHRSWLWNGFVFRIGEGGRVARVLLALQLLDDAADRLGRSRAPLPQWYPWQDGDTGVVVAADGEERLSVRAWYEESRELLEQYADLEAHAR